MKKFSSKDQQIFEDMKQCAQDLGLKVTEIHTPATATKTQNFKPLSMILLS